MLPHRALAIATAFTAAALTAGTAAMVAFAQTGKPYRSERFLHRLHLPDNPSAQDCAHCHKAEVEVASGERRFSDFKNCDQCHKGEKRVEVSIAPREARVRFVGFDHPKHRDIQCDDCHRRMEAEDAFAPVAKDRCVGCHVWSHESHDPRKPIYAGRHTRDERCETCHVEAVIVVPPRDARPAPLADGSFPFSHLRHLGKAALPQDDRALCARCHVDAAASENEGDGKLLGLRPDACDKCHDPAAGRTVAQSITSQERTFRPRLAEFPHRRHVEQFKSCSQCHELKKDDTFGFSRPGLPGYQGCVDCHKDWRVKDHEKQKNERSQTERRPIACRECHSGTNKEKPGELLTVEVKKARLGKMGFGEVAHPFICPAPAGRDARTLDDCARCHRQQKGGISSRIKDRAFGHKVHFAPEARERSRVPGPEACQACHAGIYRSEGAETSLAVEGEKACAKCHLAAPQAGEGAAETVKAHPFGHKRHLESDQIEGCARCHGYDPQADRITTVAEAASCVKCHDHAEKADVTGRELDRCLKCHLGNSLFRPAVAVAKADPTKVTASFEARHKEYQGECNQCHPAEGGLGRKVELRSITGVAHANDRHGPMSREQCKECHIRPVMGGR